MNPHGSDENPQSLAMVADVTETARANEALRRRALYDELTGLPNRSLLSDRLTQALTRSTRYSLGEVAVLFVDLDLFKLVNESLGHAAGDQLLSAVADRLHELQATTNATVARFAGDEFVVMAEDCDSAAADALAEQVLGVLQAPFHIGKQQLYVNASIGIALSPVQSADELLRFADGALHEAKAAGRGQAVRFDPEIAVQAADRLSLSNDLRDALRRDELDLYYQPLIDLGTGDVVGVEALARWHHPQRGPISPAVFVDVAESAGLPGELDRPGLAGHRDVGGRNGQGARAQHRRRGHRNARAAGDFAKARVP